MKEETRRKLAKLRALGVSSRALKRIEELSAKREAMRTTVTQIEEEEPAALPAPPMAKALPESPLDQELALLDAEIERARGGSDE